MATQSLQSLKCLLGSSLASIDPKMTQKDQSVFIGSQNSSWMNGQSLLISKYKCHSKSKTSSNKFKIHSSVDSAAIESFNSETPKSDYDSGRSASVDTVNESAKSAEDFSVKFDNESSPGRTVIEIQGFDQDELLSDVTTVLRACNLSVKAAKVMTQNNRVLDVFVVVDSNTKSALTEKDFPLVKEVLLNKLNDKRRIFTSNEDPILTEQVSFLISRLQKVIIGFGGEKIIESANYLQQGFEILSKKESPRKRAELLRYIEKMDENTLTGVIRTFYLYSSLLNVADESHSHRKRREQLALSKKGTPLWYASFNHTLNIFKQMNISEDELQKLLNKIEYNPVFTAHPTEARRREILTCLHRIFLRCGKREDPTLSIAQKSEIEEEIEAELELMWRTDEMRSRKPSVIEEVQTGLDYFRFSLFDAVCVTYRNAENSIQQLYPDSNIQVPSFIKFGSWIGGDRDGNPFVFPETTEVAAILQSRLILAEYIKRLKICQDTFTHSTLIISVSDEFKQSLKQKNSIIQKIVALKNDAELYAQEPYRLKLRVMRHRLEQNIRIINSELRRLSDAGFANETMIDLEYNIENVPGLDPQEDAYDNEEEFLNDLQLINSSLRSHGDSRLAEKKLKDLIRLAETFGFYLCSLDVRQESTIHSNAVAECLKLLGDDKNYMELDDAEKMNLLSQYLQSPPPQDKFDEIMNNMSEETKKVISVFFSISNMIHIISDKSFATYVISMTRQAFNILEVYFLAWLSCKNLVYLSDDGKLKSNMTVTPLFETIPDLERMPVALNELINCETYLDLLKSAGNTQEVMLGYSDSCKDGGIMASAFNLYKAQNIIKDITKQANINFRIFHGRGGTVGRGAGPTHDSVLAQPAGSVNGEIKFTEQGEVITYRYGNAETAIYELTVGITAVMKASTPKIMEASGNIPSEYFDIMEEIVKKAERSYRDLTDDTEGFYDYFYESTVVNEISLMNIGSRPSRRNVAVRDKSSLRAIPWVFGWAQSRHTIPGWYGVGSGLVGYTDNKPEKIKKLQTMYQTWPFFKTFLSNVQMSLFKASMEIAKEYSRLCKNRIDEQLVYDLVLSEYNLTKSQILMVSQLNELQEDNNSLKRSFETRRLYLDPLNHIQVILLGRRRDPNATPEQFLLWEKPLLRTIKAIASNMRNTG